jgi:hypothetical protein
MPCPRSVSRPEASAAGDAGVIHFDRVVLHGHVEADVDGLQAFGVVALPMPQPNLE